VGNEMQYGWWAWGGRCGLVVGEKGGHSFGNVSVFRSRVTRFLVKSGTNFLPNLQGLGCGVGALEGGGGWDLSSGCQGFGEWGVAGGHRSC